MENFTLDEMRERVGRIRKQLAGAEAVLAYLERELA
jgi:hypothetical protein